MAGFQNFTPRTANLAKVWEGFNPAANFLGGMKATQQMDLDAAVEERLRESAEVDRLVKMTMLPYDERLANARIGATQAQASLYASRAERDTEDLASAALLSGLEGQSYGQLKSLFKGGADEPATSSRQSSPPVRMSLEGAETGFSETPSPLSFFEETEETGGSSVFDAMVSPELTNPKYALASAPSAGVSTDVPANNAAMQVLEKRNADAPKVSPTTLLDSKQTEDLRNIRSSLYKDSNPLLNMPEIQAREAKKLAEKKDDSLGRFISDEYAFIQEQDNLASLLDKKNPERFTRQATVKAMSARLPLEAAKKFGISPAAVPMLVYSSRGVLRSPEEINQIHGAMKDGFVDLPNGQQYEVKSPEDAVALVEKRRTMGPTVAKVDDSIKVVNEVNTAMKAVTDAEGNPLPGKEAEYDEYQARKDTALKLPTGLSAYSDRYARASDKQNKLKLAYSNGIDYGDTLKDEIPQAIAKLDEDKVRLAVDKAPFFNPETDREKMQKWLTDPATKNLPFNTLVEGVAATLEPTAKTNVYNRWSPVEKKWVSSDFNKKETASAAAAPETPAPKTPNQSGKSLSAVVRPYFENPETLPNARDKVIDRLGDTALNVGEYANTAIRNRVVAPTAEFLAGLAGEELALDRTPNPKPEDRPKQLTIEEKLQIIERLTGGPLKGAGKETIKKVYSRLTQ